MKKFIKNKKILLLLILLALGLFIGSTSLAVVKCDGRQCNSVDWPKSPLGPLGTDINPTCEMGKCKYVDLSILIKYLYEWGIALGGLATFIALLIAGFQYLTSVGEPAKMTEAKNSIYSALFGLVLLLSSWLILNTINPQFTTFHPSILSLEKIISPYQPCEKPEDCEPCTKDEECPEGSKCETGYCSPLHFKCLKGYCFPKEIANNPCKTAELTIGDATTTLTKEEECRSFLFDIKAGETVVIKGVAKDDSTDCVGFVLFYLGERCKREHAYVPVNSTYVPDEKIQSIKLFVPE